MNIKKVFAVLLAMVLILSLTITAFAEEPTYTITIDKNEAGRVYKAYQIFTGDISSAEMTNIQWGADVTDAGRTALQTEYGVDSAQKVAGKLTNSDDAKAFAEKVAPYLVAGSGDSFTFATDKYTGTVTGSGYYLIKEETVLGSEVDKSVSAYIMHVVKDVTVTPKDNQPTIEKKVSDINDSLNGEYINLVDSADHDIGDDVPFHVHVKLGDGISHYSEYKVVVTDTLSKGLTFKEGTFVAKLGTHTLPAKNYQINTVTDASGNTILTITFEDLFALVDDADQPLKDGEKLIVPNDGSNLILEYKARLNEDAVIGSDGNTNEVYMTYSNNPHSDTMGKTKTDTVIVFTYRLDVEKTDGTSPLGGAAFALYKNDFDGNWDLVKTFAPDAHQTEFSFEGLDDGEYKLVETAAPAGYNKIEDQVFNIVADHKDGTLELISLNGVRVSGTIELSHDVATGTLSTTIVNEKGATLPSTGGIGTTIFYVLGGVLACGAVVLLITQKRMRREG